MGPVEKVIKEKVIIGLNPVYLELENESHQHSVPPGSETHFRLLVVSDVFEGESRISRQRKVNDLLKVELEGPIHALTQRALTPSEYKSQNSEFKSPNCRGKNLQSD